MAGRGGTSQTGAGRPRLGRAGAGVGRGTPGAAPPGWVGRSGVRSGPGWQCEEHLVAAAVCVEAMREREVGERNGGTGTIPAYVCQSDTPADELKQAGLRGGCGALCSSATRRTYITYVGLKINERNLKYERRSR
jgi:hypothetical protein